MKRNPRLDSVQRAMETGIISGVGFLGEDTRNLTDILDEDDRYVKSRGLTHEKIARIMESITEKGREGFGNPVEYCDYYEVTVEESRGMIACPFGHKGMYPKENIYVLNKKNGESMCWTRLNIHMIKEHGFYEGKGSPFRVEPERIIKLLGL